LSVAGTGHTDNRRERADTVDALLTTGAGATGRAVAGAATVNARFPISTFCSRGTFLRTGTIQAGLTSVALGVTGAACSTQAIDALLAATALVSSRAGLGLIAPLLALLSLLLVLLVLAPLLAVLLLLGLSVVILESGKRRDAECSGNTSGRNATKYRAAAGAFIREGYGESVETILFHYGLLWPASLRNPA
jgi:hypothetical protein